MMMEGVDPAEFALSPETCRRLREEAAQYYHRYVAFFVLEEFDAVVRDTSRNLRLLDFFNEFAHDDQDRGAVDQFRPYIVMMRARALATQAVRDGESKAAKLAIDDGVEAIRRHFDDAGAPASAFEQSKEVQLLRGMGETLVPRLPKSPMAELKDRLQKAVEDENYELAAILRDELRQMGGQWRPAPGRLSRPSHPPSGPREHGSGAPPIGAPAYHVELTDSNDSKKRLPAISDPGTRRNERAMTAPKQPIYMDNAATTRCDPRVVEAMLPYFTEKFGNPGSRNHRFGWDSEEAVDVARGQVAELIGAGPKEIVFTSGSTESNNLAIKGAAEMYAKKPEGETGRGHIISAIHEHKAVLDPVKRLEKRGFDVHVAHARGGRAHHRGDGSGRDA